MVNVATYSTKHSYAMFSLITYANVIAPWFFIETTLDQAINRYTQENILMCNKSYQCVWFNASIKI